MQYGNIFEKTKKIGKTVTQRNICFWAEQFAQQKMLSHEKKPWGKIEMSNIWNEISGLTVVKEITPELRQEINGTGGFLCGLVRPHVVRYLIENMVIKMTRNNGRRTFCTVLRNRPIKIRKRLENLNSTLANLCDVISSIQPYLSRYKPIWWCRLRMCSRLLCSVHGKFVRFLRNGWDGRAYYNCEHLSKNLFEFRCWNI